MAYEVTDRHVPYAGEGGRAPGVHYTVEDPSRDSWFQRISFYRSPGGREVATDVIGVRLADDGDLFRSVRAAVEEYDKEH